MPAGREVELTAAVFVFVFVFVCICICLCLYLAACNQFTINAFGAKSPRYMHGVGSEIQMITTDIQISMREMI